MNYIFLILGTAMLILSGCQNDKKHNGHEHGNLTYVATSPVKKDTFVNKEYVCQIRAIQHIELRALERGYLQDIFVDEGQFIKKGQLMFRIMPIFYQAEYRKAEAELQTEQSEFEFVQIEYENTKSLADSNIVSKNELALARAKLKQAQAKVDQAKAKLSLAEVHLKFTEIKAPFDGIMDRFQVRLGSLVDEGELLTVLSDNSKVWVYFNVPEAEYLDYKTGTTNNKMLNTQLKMANNKMFDQMGVVETIEADFQNETGNIAFRATFPNPDKLLRHGETGNIVITAPHKDAVIIPQKATFEILEKKYVFVIDKDNVARQREVKIAAEMPDLYVIRSGLKSDEKILLEGIRKVKDNEKIKFTYEDPEKVLSKLKVYVE